MDTTANLLTSIRNAELAGHQTVQVPTAKLSKAIVTILQQKGYVIDVSEADAKLSITLKPETRTHYRQISKPGRRLYVDAKSIPVVRQGLGMVILSTSNGLLTGYDAKKQGLGGEIICEVF